MAVFLDSGSFKNVKFCSKPVIPSYPLDCQGLTNASKGKITFNLSVDPRDTDKVKEFVKAVFRRKIELEILETGVGMCDTCGFKSTNVEKLMNHSCPGPVSP